MAKFDFVSNYSPTKMRKYYEKKKRRKAKRAALAKLDSIEEETEATSVMESSAGKSAEEKENFDAAASKLEESMALREAAAQAKKETEGAGAEGSSEQSEEFEIEKCEIDAVEGGEEEDQEKKKGVTIAAVKEESEEDNPKSSSTLNEETDEEKLSKASDTVMGRNIKYSDECAHLGLRS